MLIGIDHGNKQIKSRTRIFTSGLCESDTRPPFGENILFYSGKYYTLSDERIPYMRDKAKDERSFILTLFSIAFELENAGNPAEEVIDIQPGIGLPPAHYGTQYGKFEKYFLGRGILDFRMDSRPYAVFISKALRFPQA